MKIERSELLASIAPRISAIQNARNEAERFLEARALANYLYEFEAPEDVSSVIALELAKHPGLATVVVSISPKATPDARGRLVLPILRSGNAWAASRFEYVLLDRDLRRFTADEIRILAAHFRPDEEFDLLGIGEMEKFARRLPEGELLRLKIERCARNVEHAKKRRGR